MTEIQTNYTSELLHLGARIEITFDEGDPGAVNEDGDVTSDPTSPLFHAIAYDHADNTLAVGTSITTAAEALADLKPVGEWPESNDAPF